VGAADAVQDPKLSHIGKISAKNGQWEGISATKRPSPKMGQAVVIQPKPTN
jgi:hypothetical protein